MKGERLKIDSHREMRLLNKIESLKIRCVPTEKKYVTLSVSTVTIVQERKRQEEEERKRQEELERQKQLELEGQQHQEKLRLKEQKREKFKEEPARTEPNVTTLAIRLASGEQRRRRFRTTDLLQASEKERFIFFAKQSS
jgi:membrane protein involved in colicin uptake